MAAITGAIQPAIFSKKKVIFPIQRSTEARIKSGRISIKYHCILE